MAFGYLLKKCKTKACSEPIPVHVAQIYYDQDLGTEVAKVKFKMTNKEYVYPVKNIFQDRNHALWAKSNGFIPE